MPHLQIDDYPLKERGIASKSDVIKPILHPNSVAL